jgi:hypothetical protein
MSLDCRCLKKERIDLDKHLCAVGAIGESGMQAYCNQPIKRVEKSIRKNLGIFNVGDFLHDIYMNIINYLGRK